jgi:hypothetical protein
MKFSADPTPQFASIVKRPVDLVFESLARSAPYRALREALSADATVVLFCSSDELSPALGMRFMLATRKGEVHSD